MKILIITILLPIPLIGFSQLEMNSTSPEECVKSFFKAFHAQDSTAFKKVIHDDIIIGTIQSSSEDTVLAVDNIQQFYKSIASIPKTVKFYEELTEIKVRTEGMLAQLWTSYTFYLNEKVSHKGVNAFTLMNDGGTWKIIYLVDTRRRED